MEAAVSMSFDKSKFTSGRPSRMSCKQNQKEACERRNKLGCGKVRQDEIGDSSHNLMCYMLFSASFGSQ